MGIEKEITTRSYAVSILKWTIIAGIFIFLGHSLYENWSQLKAIPFDFKPKLILAATILYTLSYLIQAVAWYIITLKLGIALPLIDTFQTWFVSQLGKFMPGKVWLVLGRFYYYQSRGKAKKDVSVAIYLEAATLLIAAGIVSLGVIIHLNKTGLYSWKTILGLLSFCLLLALISLHPRVLTAALNKILVLLNKNPVSFQIVYSDILGVLLICLINWTFAGLSFYLLVNSVIPVPAEKLIFLSGALALASTLGLLALFAPSGLGVREGALTYILSAMMPTSAAILISVLSRFWMTIVEVAIIGTVYLTTKLLKKTKPVPE